MIANAAQAAVPAMRAVADTGLAHEASVTAVLVHDVPTRNTLTRLLRRESVLSCATIRELHATLEAVRVRHLVAEPSDADGRSLAELAPSLRSDTAPAVVIVCSKPDQSFARAGLALAKAYVPFTLVFSLSESLESEPAACVAGVGGERARPAAAAAIRRTAYLMPAQARPDALACLLASFPMINVVAYCRMTCRSRRTLERLFSSLGLPGPRWWLRWGFCLEAAWRLDLLRSSCKQVARAGRLISPAALTKLMRTAMDLRPSELGTRYGFADVVERFARQLAGSGRNASLSTHPGVDVCRLEGSTPDRS